MAFFNAEPRAPGSIFKEMSKSCNQEYSLMAKMENFQSHKILLILPITAKFPFSCLPTDNASSPAETQAEPACLQASFHSFVFHLHIILNPESCFSLTFLLHLTALQHPPDSSEILSPLLLVDTQV